MSKVIYAQDADSLVTFMHCIVYPVFTPIATQNVDWCISLDRQLLEVQTNDIIRKQWNSARMVLQTKHDDSSMHTFGAHPM